MGNEIVWLSQEMNDLPKADDWLSESEKKVLASFRFPKRRNDWKLGRWTVKRAVSFRESKDISLLPYFEVRAAADGAVGWNPARFINHSCSPNCDAELIEGQIWIIARRAIPSGEEITFNYSYDLDDYLEHPCQCGSPDCVGYIVAEEFFPEIRKRVAQDRETKITPANPEP